MNKQVAEIKAADEVKPTGLDLMRAPFPPNQISKLPKPTRGQTDAVKKDFKKGIRCKICGGWHHPSVVHLDYVGHAALTDRLLDCDPNWNWEPIAKTEHGTPLFDQNGGMWINLTVCGVTRMGYGHPDGKQGGDAMKEVIGDALRNAAMRFGAALDLWHKGDLHADDSLDNGSEDDPQGNPAATVSPDQYIKLRDKAHEAGVSEEAVCERVGCPDLQQFPAAQFDSVMKKLAVTIEQRAPKNADLGGDDIPEFSGEHA